MNIKKVTVIVPRLPPAVDGLGDYGLSLARQLRLDFGVQSEFIVGDPNWIGGTEIEGFKINKISARSVRELIKFLPNNNQDHAVILHYVGYGYAKRGSPVWLIQALAKWRNDSDNGKLITMFHELYAFGPVWTSQFWTSPLQKYLAKQLGFITDAAITSKQGYATIMSNLTNHKHSKIPVLAIFSNIGEPENIRPLSARSKRIVVFGGKGSRARVYQDSREELIATCKKFAINEIIDVGPLLNFEIEPIDGVKIIAMGVQESNIVSELLLDSLIGYMNYSTAYLCKSGIFAAYCSHGVLPIVSTNVPLKTDGVKEGVHYWSGGKAHDLSNNLAEAQKTADTAYFYYKDHSIAVHARTFFHLL